VTVATEAFGGLDVLVNNAGFGFIGAIEEATPDEYRPMFETNIIGLLETTRAALPALRKTGAGGRNVNNSSGAGIKGLQGSGHYNATKFAVEGISEALAQEVAPFGIAVIIVEPGPLRTDFLGRSISLAKKEMPEYAGTAGVFRTFRANNDGIAGRRPGQGRQGHPEGGRRGKAAAAPAARRTRLRPRAHEDCRVHPGHRRLGGGGEGDRLRVSAPDGLEGLPVAIGRGLEAIWFPIRSAPW